MHYHHKWEGRKRRHQFINPSTYLSSPTITTISTYAPPFTINTDQPPHTDTDTVTTHKKWKEINKDTHHILKNNNCPHPPLTCPLYPQHVSKEERKKRDRNGTKK
jgi:hypothetical protein